MTPTQGTASSRPQTSRRSDDQPRQQPSHDFAAVAASPAASCWRCRPCWRCWWRHAGPRRDEHRQRGTSGYNQKPPTPTTKTEPKKEVEPSKEVPKTTPKTAVEPAKEGRDPTTTTPKASTLPFTGLNLTWVVGAGVLLLGAGLSIRLSLRTRSGR